MQRGSAERVKMIRTSPWWGEHRSRYHWAAEDVAGRSVLDVASGTGYGLGILKDAGAAFVVGIDRDTSAVSDASVRDLPEITVAVGDAENLPIRSESFDVVTSFETVEHLNGCDGFFQEVQRVLNPGGAFLMSTPNALITQPRDGNPRNPFHVHEFDPVELRERLSEHFDEVVLAGQIVVGAFGFCPIWSEKDRSGRPSRTAVWRGIHRFVPFAIKDRVARVRHNRGFYPGEFDFVFNPMDVESAHVLVAKCLK